MNPSVPPTSQGSSGFPADAKDELQKGLVLSRMAGSSLGEGLALTYLGIMADVTGNGAAARSYFQQALAVHTSANNRNSISSAQLNLAVSLWRAADWNRRSQPRHRAWGSCNA